MYIERIINKQMHWRMKHLINKSEYSGKGYTFSRIKQLYA
jgi:hypothetical protein